MENKKLKCLNYFSILLLWKKRDDNLLRFAVLKYGKSNWYKIKNVFFFNKGGIQNCRFRWFNWLICDIKKTKWTDKEDKKLIFLKKKKFFGYWRFIVFFMKRTPVQCLFRFLFLYKIFIKSKLSQNNNNFPERIIALEKIILHKKLKKSQLFQFRKNIKKKTSLNTLGNIFMARFRGMNWLGKKRLRLGFDKRLTSVKKPNFLKYYFNLTKINKKNNKKKIGKGIFFFYFLLMIDFHVEMKKSLKKKYPDYLKVSPFFFFHENYF
ncbi:cdc5-like protein (nucleomorph) [Chroomonas mesostigmatica CCMP1168]|uniref:Cdc5-like protein n=1 Tax=Chroomonas mesostigmatica CCMP1168 TaxID=1195612 RepID=J7G6E0_9CRYP|nr:cdc5-like protein [Chroomonas mesostigmatica CCMP1168]|mmetsp:Transcript_58829/g.144235  ORF Transcript_58829/g.144235 Transcript_58829/m.144235 type:complete len:265 (+) Transcript_58829:205-999(+)